MDIYFLTFELFWVVIQDKPWIDQFEYCHMQNRFNIEGNHTLIMYRKIFF